LTANTGNTRSAVLSVVFSYKHQQQQQYTSVSGKRRKERERKKTKRINLSPSLGQSGANLEQ